jgi:multimeric flavodoxin WrbA
MKGVIVQASARSEGHTSKLVNFVKKETGFDVIDLKKFTIESFDYDVANQTDDFIPLIKRIADDYEQIIFATPIYWYTMSGVLKNFLDRITDCLKLEKETGRKLRGKKLSVISCSSGNEIKDGFHMPFIETANYLGMSYHDDVHGWIENEEIPEMVLNNLNRFVSSIENSN